MLKSGLRISAALALLFAMCLTALLYLPMWNEVGKIVLRAMGGDKIVHVVFGALVPLCLAFLARLYQASKRLQWAFWVSCLLLFAGDETLQQFSPQRESDITDLAMSALGWSIGCSFWWLIWLVTQKKRANQ